MLYSCEGCVLGCGAFVDGDEVLPVVEDVGANLLGGFHGGKHPIKDVYLDC